jgi:NADPH-dependent 2,4-dienoyl-CoA reductase/sulfur reductase-like enzyme
MFLPHGSNVYLAAEIKKHVTVPVATIGGLNDPEMMEEIIASGKADVVEMARALLADPELPKKVMSNRDGDIIHCLRCFTCMAERAVTSTRRCTVNPLIGRELDGTEIHPVAKPKKVLVVGGGPGGLQAALTAAKRGHNVVLCEKSNQLGGILVGEQALPFKQEMYMLGNTLGKLTKDEGVDIRLNTPVDQTYAKHFNADAVIIAVGSAPIVPSIPGLDGEQVIIVNDYYLNTDKVADTVVVLGGGLAGCEAAIHFAMEGKAVYLVEMRSELAPDANIRHRPILLSEIEKQKIHVHTGYKGIQVTKDGVLCLDADNGEHLVEGKTVICALGQRPRRDVVEELLDTAPYVATIGDCVKASTITTAIYQGHHAALDI